MSENEAAINNGAAEGVAPEASTEEITYHAVEKDGVVTAIWEMQGRKHLRTIDPRSRQGQDILRLYTTEHHDEVVAKQQRRSGLTFGYRQPSRVHSFTQPSCAVRSVQTLPNYLLIDRRASAWPGD
jgi:hypothetical protein